MKNLILASTTVAFAACGAQPPITVDPVEAACSALEEGTPCKEAVDQFQADITALQTQAHDRYADAEAVSAMGLESDTNTLNHARYTGAECVAAVNAGGVLASSIEYDPANSSLFAGDVQNALDEVAAILDNTGAGPHYNDTDAVSAVAAAGYVAGVHFTAADAIGAMGAPNDANSLNHTRYTDAESLGAVAGGGYVTGTHYIDADAIAAMGTVGNGNALNHDRYGNAEAVASMGTVGNTNTLNHDRYTDADAVSAVGPHPSGTFCGTTAASYSGDIGGWAVVKGICETACGSTSAHICNPSEIERSWQYAISIPTNGWITSGVASIYDGTANRGQRSCLGWKSNVTTEYGHTTEAGSGGDGWIRGDNCSASYPITCCD